MPGSEDNLTQPHRLRPFERSLAAWRRLREMGSNAAALRKLRSAAALFSWRWFDTPPGVLRYLALLGEFQLRRGDLREAARLLTFVEQQLEGVPTTEARSLQVDFGRLVRAVTEHEQLLDTNEFASADEIRLEEEAPGLQSLNHEAVSRCRRGHSEEALPLLERNVERAFEFFGPKDSSCAALLINLASAKAFSGDYRGAERAYRQAADVLQGKNDEYERLLLFACFQGLTATRRAQDDPLGASQEALAGLNLLRGILPALHPGLLLGMAPWARLTMALGDAVEAQEVMREMLVILDSNLGSKHPFAGGILADLAQVCEQLEHFDEARNWWSYAGESARQDPAGWRQEVTWRIRHGRLERLMGNRQTARRILLQSYRNAVARGGRDHRATAPALYELGCLAAAKGALVEAEVLLRHVVLILRQRPGVYLNTWVKAEERLARVLEKRLGRKMAWQERRDGLLQFEIHAVPGADLCHALRTLAGLERDVISPTKGWGRLQEARVLAHHRLGPAHPQMVEILGEMGEWLTQREDATSLLRHALRVARRTFGEPHPQVARALERLAWREATPSEPTRSLDLLREAAQMDDELMNRVLEGPWSLVWVPVLTDIRRRFDRLSMWVGEFLKDSGEVEWVAAREHQFHHVWTELQDGPKRRRRDQLRWGEPRHRRWADLRRQIDRVFLRGPVNTDLSTHFFHVIMQVLESYELIIRERIINKSNLLIYVDLVVGF